MLKGFLAFVAFCAVLGAVAAGTVSVEESHLTYLASDYVVGTDHYGVAIKDNDPDALWYKRSGDIAPTRLYKQSGELMAWHRTFARGKWVQSFYVPASASDAQIWSRFKGRVSKGAES